MEVRNYIRNNWKKSVRIHNKMNNSIAVPFPYNSPCAEGLFDELYYWDTYFLNRGLLKDQLFEQAKNNILDISYLISKYGFMPNANRLDMINRSQPPFFISMVIDYYTNTLDKSIFQSVIKSMNLEMEFWIKNRTVYIDNKLAFQYRSHALDEHYIYMAKEYKQRVKKIIDENEDDLIIGKNVLAECESGWDFSIRFNQRILNYLPIDLNSMMYFNLTSLEQINRHFDYQSNYDYKDIAFNLLKILNNKCYKDGIYYDYDFVNNKISSIISMASFYPFKFNIYNDKKAFNYLYNKLIHQYGLSTTEKEDEHNYQWGYPNMWPCLMLIAFDGAINNKDDQKAIDIAKLYINTVDKEFARSNKLWEKYDVNIGTRSILNEYSETEMLGWTAGSYVAMYDYLKELDQ